MSGAELDMSNGRVALASYDWEVIGWVDLDQLTDDEVADGEFGHALIGSVDVPSPADAAWIIAQYGGGEFDGEVGGVITAALDVIEDQRRRMRTARRLTVVMMAMAAAWVVVEVAAA